HILAIVLGTLTQSVSLGIIAGYSNRRFHRQACQGISGHFFFIEVRYLIARSFQKRSRYRFLDRERDALRYTVSGFCNIDRVQFPYNHANNGSAASEHRPRPKQRARGHQEPSFIYGGGSGVLAIRFASRMRLKIPATNPSMNKMISPQGDVPKTQSIRSP